MSLDRNLWDAKDRVTKALCRVIRDKGDGIDELGMAIDDLNKSWDKLTDALCRQREERDKQIVKLLDELAERPEK